MNSKWTKLGEAVDIAEAFNGDDLVIRQHVLNFQNDLDTDLIVISLSEAAKLRDFLNEYLMKKGSEDASAGLRESSAEG